MVARLHQFGRISLQVQHSRCSLTHSISHLGGKWLPIQRSQPPQTPRAWRVLVGLKILNLQPVPDGTTCKYSFIEGLLSRAEFALQFFYPALLLL
jgi:hypothetical protein